MMSFLDSWLVWAGLGGGTIGLVVLALLAPSVLQVVATFVSGLVKLALPLLAPAAAAIGKFAGMALSALATGFFRVLDDGKQIAFVATLAVTCYAAGAYLGRVHAIEAVITNDCKPLIDDLHRQFKFIPRGPNEPWRAR